MFCSRVCPGVYKTTFVYKCCVYYPHSKSNDIVILNINDIYRGGGGGGEQCVNITNSETEQTMDTNVSYLVM